MCRSDPKPEGEEKEEGTQQDPGKQKEVTVYKVKSSELAQDIVPRQRPAYEDLEWNPEILLNRKDLQGIAAMPRGSTGGHYWRLHKKGVVRAEVIAALWNATKDGGCWRYVLLCTTKTNMYVQKKWLDSASLRIRDCQTKVNFIRYAPGAS